MGGCRQTWDLVSARLALFQLGYGASPYFLTFFKAAIFFLPLVSGQILTPAGMAATATYRPPVTLEAGGYLCAYELALAGRYSERPAS